MRQPYNVAVLAGSLREGSYTRRVARHLAGYPAPLAWHEVEIGGLPFYNEDLETETPPEAWQALRNSISVADAVLFATPEYNRSVPAVLKNALDVGSRPYGKNTWEGKPAAVISVSPGAIGAFGANHHLRQSLVFLDMPVMAQPEAYIGNAARLFDDGGALGDPGVDDFLRKFMESFVRWVERFHAPSEAPNPGTQ